MPVFTERETQLRPILEAEKDLDFTAQSRLQSKLPLLRDIHVKLNAQLVKLTENPMQFADKAAYAAAWNSAVDNALSQLSGLFHASPTGAELSPKFRIEWMQRIYVQECVAISSARIEGWRDQYFFLCAFEANMTKLTVELTDKWNGFIDGKKSSTDPETKAIAIVAESLEKSIKDSRRLHQRIIAYGEEKKKNAKESHVKFISKLIETVAGKTLTGRILENATSIITTYLGGATGAVIAASTLVIKEGIKVAASSILESGRQLNEASEQFKNWTLKAGYPIGMFKKNRELVANYRSEADLKKLDAANTAAQAALKNREDYFAKCNFPPAMMRDCETFAKDMTGKFKVVHDRCVQVDKDFKAKFQGVFEGAASETTIEQLTNVKMLTGLVADTVQRVDYTEPNREAQKLLPAAQAISTETTNIATDPSNLPEEIKVIMLAESAEFKRAVAAHFEEMKRAIDEYEAYTRKLKELREEAVRKLDRQEQAATLR